MADEGDTKKPQHRIIFIGDSGVGKTTLIHRATHDEFLRHPNATIGAGIIPITVSVEGQSYEFQLWDSAGQKMYRNIVPLYFRGASCAVLVFTLDQEVQYTELVEWISLVEENSSDKLPIVLVGNKLDLLSDKVDLGSVRQWASNRDIECFFTSAATGENISMLMNYLAVTYASSELPNDDTVHIKNDGPVAEPCC